MSMCSLITRQTTRNRASQPRHRAEAGASPCSQTRSSRARIARAALAIVVALLLAAPAVVYAGAAPPPAGPRPAGQLSRTAEQTGKPAVPRKLDFGTDTSPVAEGYTRVTARTTYAPSRGYGWSDGEIVDRDRERGDDLRRDLNFTDWGTFVVDLPNGAYDVTLTIGDAISAHEEMGIILQGTRVDSLTTAVNQFLVKTYRVTIIGGQLELVLDDLGGEDLFVVINGLEIDGPIAAP